MSSIADRLKRLAQQKSQAAKVDIRALLLSKKAAPSSDDIRSKLLKLGNRPTETVAVPELAPGEIKAAPSFFDQIGNVKEKKGRAKAQVLDVAIGKEEDEDPPWAKKRAQRSPVSRSDEWHRIYALPRRSVDFSTPPNMDHLRKPGGTFTLNPIQAWALAEIEKNGGLAGPLAVGAGKCCRGDMEVFDTANGRRRRVDEIGSFSVSSMTRRHQIGSFGAHAFFSGVKPCLTLKLRDGSSLTVSTDHPVFTPDGWKKAGELEVDDLVATPRKQPEPEKPLEILETEVAFVAYMMADGRCKDMPSFTNANESVLSDFEKVVVALGGKIGARAKKSKAWTLNVCKLQHILRARGIDDLSRNKRLPAEFYGLSDEHVALFLNRFVACDGHVNHNKGEIEIGLASEKLIDDLRFLFLRLGVATRKRFKWSGYGNGYKFPSWRLCVTGRDNVCRALNALGPVIGKEESCTQTLALLKTREDNTNVDVVPVGVREFSEICDELGLQGLGGDWKTRQPGRPRTALKKFLGVTAGQRIGRRKFREFRERYNYAGKHAWLADAEVLWIPVQSIVDEGEDLVYDLSVPETECFIANNVVIHNSVISMLAPTVLKAERALLFVPPQLKEKVLRKDIPKFFPHFKIELHRFKVESYSTLSVASGSDLLTRLKPDVLILDEAHAVKDPKSTRTKRMRRYLKENPGTKVVILTGTATRNSIRDIAMLYEWALKAGSPVPGIKHFHELMDWAEALDVSDDPLDPGALVEFCNEEERRIIYAASDSDPDSMKAKHNAVRAGFRRRVVSTPGVVATQEGAIATSLQITALRPNLPVEVTDALIKLRLSWEIEGYEAFEDAMRVAVAARQIASGFFLRWAWEKLEGNAEGKKDMDWLQARRNWHKEVRDILKRSREGLDSPLLVAKAAASGKIKTEHWEAWAAQKHKPVPPTEAVWISDFLLHEAAEWGRKTCSKKEGGIIWVLNPCVGERLSELTGWKYFGAGDKASNEIINMTPDKAPVIIASLDAHGTGKDLQTYCRNLYTSPPSSPLKWEQSLARTHRPGQLADLVSADVFMHTAENEAAFQGATEEAEFIEATTGQKQKLLYADKVDLG